MDAIGTSDLQNALGSLPDDAILTGDMVIYGHVLRAAAGTFRVVTGALALEFAHDDVLEILEIADAAPESPASASLGLAIPVRLRLKPGARLFGCSPAAAYLPLLERPVEPFAYLVRKTPPAMQPAPRWRAIEQAYRERCGLE